MSGSAKELARRRQPISINELAASLGARVEGQSHAAVSGIEHDSRRVDAGDLFVARRGATFDGVKFIQDAIQKGASAILTETDTEVPPLGATPVVRVADLSGALAAASALVYEDPSAQIKVCGVTGTNGKTTVTHLVRAAVDRASSEKTCGLIGTVGHEFRELHFPASHTTPEVSELNQLLATFRAAGATYAAMEVSSIGLSARRVEGVRFEVAALTNFTQDHLDYHGTMEAYGEAKSSLFTRHTPKESVLCIDNALGIALRSRIASPLTVSTKVNAPNADFAPIEVEYKLEAMVATIRTPRGQLSFASRVVGAHNLENILVATAIAGALGLDVEAALAAIADERGAPGRLERCDTADDDVVVLVDYAHTPDALSRVIESVRRAGAEHIVAVFGCGGDRDRAKRGPMGKAVADSADVAIVTSDNPRREDPSEIAKPIEVALRESSLVERDVEEAVQRKGSWARDLDRAQAIARAIASAPARAVVLLCGKGHENVQIVGDREIPFDDRAHAVAALALRRNQGGR